MFSGRWAAVPSAAQARASLSRNEEDRREEVGAQEALPGQKTDKGMRARPNFKASTANRVGALEKGASGCDRRMQCLSDAI